jgi:PKD repeat protein
MKTILLKITFLALFILSLGFTSKAQAPCNANWTKTNSTDNAYKKFFSANLNDTAYKYFWSFGDGSGSDNRTPNHTYLHGGKFLVCLTVVKKDSSCTQTKCDSINVEIPTTCNANWTKTNSNDNALKKLFTATLNDTAFRYFWTFGDGGVSDNRTPNHTYLHGGKYKVCLTVVKKDSSCTQTSCDSINVETPTTCNANWTKTNSSDNALKKFFTATMNDTAYRYFWSFGDGSSSDNRTPNHTYLHGGKYLVCLTVVKKDSSCTQTKCDSINIETPNPCSANFSIFKSDSIGSNPHYVRFANTSSGTTTRCVYNFGDGTTSDNCNPIHNFSTLGSHTVCLTTYNIQGGDTLCHSTICKTFSNGSSSSATCLANFSYERIGTSNNYRFINHSTGTPLVYTWLFDGAGATHNTNAEHSFNSPGIHTICLTVRNSVDTTCFNTYCVSIITTGLVTQSTCGADFEKTIDSNTPNTFMFSSLAGDNFSNNWNFGDGTYSGDAVVSHTYTTNGNYYVCLSVISGTDSCSNMSCDSISVTSATGLVEKSLSVLSVYPNPMKDELNVKLQSKENQSCTITLFNLSGQQLVSETKLITAGQNELKVDVSNFSQGVYLIQVQIGSQILIKKIIK